jgi:thiosulfate dehydrogenase
MSAKSWLIAGAAFTSLVYGASIIGGLAVKDLKFDRSEISTHPGMAWTPPLESSIPRGPLGDSVRLGRLIFTQTPLYASQHTTAKIKCSDCHAGGGMQPFASPVVAVPALFPMFNERAGHIISLKDRVQECFVRSENGTPIDYNGEQMQAIVDYINWLSTPEPNRQKFQGRGLITLPDLQPNPAHGAQIYANHCAGCHGQQGEGSLPLFPPLWGPNSFNDGAGMNGIPKMAAFVQHNMPQNRMGILSTQEAYDVSAYIHAQRRPAFNPAYAKF